MNRRLTIQTRTLAQDAVGGRVEAWVDSFQCWAEQVNQKQSESIASEADRNIDDRQFRIRYKSGLASGTHRVLYQLRFFDIVSIVEEGIRDRMLVTCRAVQSLSV